MSNLINGPDRMMESAITEGEKAMKDPLKYLMQKIASLNDKFVFWLAFLQKMGRIKSSNSATNNDGII